MDIVATKASESASAATFTPELSDHESGDVLAVWVVHARVASTISIDGTDTSNFTDPSGSFDTKEAGSGTNVSCALFVCAAASSSEVGPLLTQNTAADEWYAMCHTYRNCNVSDIVEAASTASFSSAKNGTLLQVTPTNSNCLIAYFMCADTNARGSQFQAGIEGFCADTATLDIASGIIQHAPGSTITPALEWIGTLGAQDGVYATIAFNDSGSTPAPGLDASNLNTTAQLPNFSTTPSTAAFNVTAAPTDLTSLFDGSWPFSTPVNLAPSGGSTFAIQPEIKGAGACMASVASIGGSHNGQHVISAVSINSVSFTGKLLLLTIGHSAGAAKLGDISQGGGYIVLSDGTEVAAFRVTALNSSPTSVNGTMGVVIDPINTTPTYESANVGSIDFTAITSIGVMHYVTTVTESFCIAGVNTLDISSNKAFIARGGHTAQPVSFETFFGPLNSQGLKAFPNQSGFTAGQYFSPVPLQIGDGTTKTVTNLNTQSLAFAGPATARYLSYFLPQGTGGLRIVFSTSDEFESGSVLIDGGDFRPFVIDNTTGGNPASASFAGMTVLRHDVQIPSLGTDAYDGMALSGCLAHTDDIHLGGVTISDVASGEIAGKVITGATQSELQTKINNLDGLSLTNHTNAPALRIVFTGTGDVTLSNVNDLVCSGNTVDVHFNSTNASTLTLVLTGASNPSTKSVSGAAVDVVFSNDVTFTVDIVDENDSALTGAELTILSTGTQTEQHHVETSTASEDFTFTAPLGVNVDVQVYKPGYETFWRANLDLGSVNSSLTAKLISIPGYEA